ncbi:MAG: DUF4956 domain-containing protein [Clostridia bacterium]
MDLTGLFAELQKAAEMNAHLDIWRVVLTILISTGLGLSLAFLYLKTFKGTFYSQSFVHTLVIVSVVIAMIIMVIGSNIGQAFALAGALSIIRFRSAIRDPRDVAFIFFAMGSGLACGAGFFVPAIVFVLLVGITIILFKITNFGSKNLTRKMLRISMPETMNQEGVFEDIFAKYLKDYSLIGIKTVSLGTLYELRFSILMKPEMSEKMLLDEVRTRNGNLNVSLLLEQQMLDY